MKVLQLFVLFAEASMSDPTNCYILDVFLLLYSIIFTALYFREKVSWVHAQIVPSEEIYLTVLNTNLCSALYGLVYKGRACSSRDCDPGPWPQWACLYSELSLILISQVEVHVQGSNILQYVLTYIALNASFLLWSAFYLIKY